MPVLQVSLQTTFAYCKLQTNAQMAGQKGKLV